MCSISSRKCSPVPPGATSSRHRCGSPRPG
ncbi:MAG: hypothetical protein DCC66_08635 [Planctomycetota bacterium]|nr:MAG: hypothetical protein DCC66_08635 [Planctomycetota bacterium]